MQKSSGFDDSRYSEADKIAAREYAHTKVLIEPQLYHADPGLESRRGGVSVTMPSFPVTENPFHSTDTRRVAAHDTGRQALRNDRGEAQYYQAYLEASSVVRKTMLARVQEQKKDYDAQVSVLLSGVSLDTQPVALSSNVSESQTSRSHDYAIVQKRLEAEADQYASDCLTLAGPTQQENMKLFQEARNEYLFADQARRLELKTMVRSALQHATASTGAEFLPQSTRQVSNSASRAPSITEDAYVARAVVAFNDFGMTARDARHNYKEASKNPAELEGLEQTLVEMEREKSRSPRQ